MGKKSIGQKAQSKLTSYSGYKRSVRKTGRKRNVFPFLELPAELRLQIYEYALPKHKKHPSQQNSCKEEGILCLYEKDRKTRRPKGFVALMTTNQMVYQETVKVLYGIPPRGCSPPVKLHVGDSFMRIQGYEFFCKTHHVFDKGLQSIFARFRYIELYVHAFCSPYPDEVPGMYDVYDVEADDDVEEARQRCLKDNLRWVISKLRSAKSLSKMAIEQADEEFYEWCDCNGSCLNDKLESLLSPLKDITSLNQVGFPRHGLIGGRCECSLSEVSDDPETWKPGLELRLGTRMTSKEPVKDEPELFNLYDDFIHRLKKCELSGTKIDTKGLLHNAQEFREQGSAKSFKSVLDKFENELQGEVEQKIALYDKVKSLKGKAMEIKVVETGSDVSSDSSSSSEDDEPEDDEA